MDGHYDLQSHEIHTGSKSIKYLRALARAFAGAFVFSLPLQMTMEMWWLGFYISPVKLLVFMLSFLPMLICLAYYSGFESGIDWRGAVVDAFVAIAVGCLTSVICLTIFAVLTYQLSASEILGKIMKVNIQRQRSTTCQEIPSEWTSSCFASSLCRGQFTFSSTAIRNRIKDSSRELTFKHCSRACCVIENTREINHQPCGKCLH